MRPPRLRCTLFPFIYPPHLLLLPATLGLHLLLQTYPYFRALYVISVRRTKGLPTASFRFHLTVDTLAVQLYTSSLPRRVRDFHPLERAHGAQTKRRKPPYSRGSRLFTICMFFMLFFSFMHIAKFLSFCPIHLFPLSFQAHLCAVQAPDGQHSQGMHPPALSHVLYNVKDPLSSEALPESD